MTKSNDEPASRSVPKNKQITVCARYDNNKVMPWIQMCGQWLKQIGFSVDTSNTVRAMNGCLVLTAEEPAPSNGKPGNAGLLFKLMLVLNDAPGHFLYPFYPQTNHLHPMMKS